MPDTVLVTGASGFLGGRLATRLLALGHRVRLLQRSACPELEALGAQCIRASLTDANAVLAATKSCDTVFHVASKTGFWGTYDAFAQVNVHGTRNVIEACLAHKVARLVYTSTPSVVGYANDAQGIGEAPYPEKWESPYGHTKAMAEQAILAANGTRHGGGVLTTVALRPHLIYGPNDPHLLPRVIDRARRKRLVIVGPGTNRVDLTYIENAVHAHVRAADALRDPAAPPAGMAYFVSDGEPVELWPWITSLLARLDLPAPRRRVSLARAIAIGRALEWLWMTLPLPGEPPMTPFVATALARDHWYSMTPALRDFGYRPAVHPTAALDATVAWLRDSQP